MCASDTRVRNGVYRDDNTIISLAITTIAAPSPDCPVNRAGPYLLPKVGLDTHDLEVVSLIRATRSTD